MPDEPPELPDLTPAETERVRRRLADARHTDPVPDDVAARLDATLAGLVAARAEQTPAPVVDLAARRRRRVTQLLVAAVAVVAVGVGLGQVVTDLGGASDSSTSADSAAGGSGESAQPPAAAPSPESGGSGADPQSEPDPQDSGGSAVPTVRSDAFDADVQALRAQVLRTDRGEPGAFAGAAGCDRPSWGQGRRVAVRYDGVLSVLVYRPAEAGEQTVDLFGCGDDVPVRSTVVPTR